MFMERIQKSKAIWNFFLVIYNKITWMGVKQMYKIVSRIWEIQQLNVQIKTDQKYNLHPWVYKPK